MVVCKVIQRLILCLGLTSSGLTLAFDQRFSGFATLGLVSNDNPDLLFQRDISRQQGSYDGDVDVATDSVLGLQWQGRWSNYVDTTVQLVIKDRFQNSPEKAIEWAFLRYRPTDGIDLRVGRMASDIFMLSEYRQVGYGYQWARPPVDFYGLLAFYHFDGMDLTKRFDLDSGTLNVKAFYGNSDDEYPLNYQTNAVLKVDLNAGGLGMTFEANQWKWRYNWVDVSIRDTNFDNQALAQGLLAFSPYWPEAPAIAEAINNIGNHLTYHEVGVAYDNNVWWAQAEATQINSEARILPESRFYYVSLGRRIGDVSLYAIRGYAYSDNDPVWISPPSNLPSPLAEQASALAYASTLTLNGVSTRQTSIGAGVRWDFAAKMALKFQVDRYKVDHTGINLWMDVTGRGITEPQVATVVSLTWDTVF